MKHAIVIAALLVCTHASADEASKRAKIGKLAAAQGLEQMFQQQLDASKTSMKDMGTKMLRSLADPKAPRSEEDKKIQPILNRFMAEVSNMFTGKELADLWAKHYGANLTEDEVDKILAYYLSPIGQKDVKASQAAMGGFMTTFNQETEKRALKILGKLKTEIEAASKK